jgi:glycine hydroxymethyltransferase
MNPIQQLDPEVWAAIAGEMERQSHGLELIASENYISRPVMIACGSVMTNKYAEGYPGKRYYGGCEFVDVAEQLAIDRGKELFGCDHVNAQPHSGTQANTAIYLAALERGDTVLAMHFTHGGHVTHGMERNISGLMYRFVHYGVDEQTEQIDFDEVRELAKKHRPKLIVCGASAYSRTIHFSRFAEIASEVGALLMADIAHIAGLVAAKLHPDPIPHCQVVTATTHKTMRGPRGGIILSRREYAKKIDSQVFPGMQGGPLMHVIAAKAIALKEAMAPEFRVYQEQILKNARALALGMQERDYRLVAGGTDNHMALVDLSECGISGQQATELLERVGITVNMNLIPFDPKPAKQTSGIRIGSPALTSRRMRTAEMDAICDLIHCTLTQRDDQAALKKIRAQVLEMCEAYPLYQQSYHM